MVRIRRPRRLVLAVAWGAAVVAFYAEIQDELAVMGSAWATRLVVLAPAPLIMYLIWRVYFHPCVSFGQDGLQVNNVYSRYFVPYHLIAGVEGWTALTLVVSGHGRLPVHAFGAAPTGRARRDAVAAELLDRRDAAVPRAGRGFERRATLGLPEWLGPGLSLVLFLAATVGSAAG